MPLSIEKTMNEMADVIDKWHAMTMELEDARNLIARWERYGDRLEVEKKMHLQQIETLTRERDFHRRNSEALTSRIDSIVDLAQTTKKLASEFAARSVPKSERIPTGENAPDDPEVKKLVDEMSDRILPKTLPTDTGAFGPSHKLLPIVPAFGSSSDKTRTTKEFEDHRQ